MCSQQERDPERVREAALQRFRELKLEPPTLERLDRLIRSTLRAFEDDFCRRVSEQLPFSTEAALDRLLELPSPEPHARHSPQAPASAPQSDASPQPNDVPEPAATTRPTRPSQQNQAIKTGPPDGKTSFQLPTSSSPRAGSLKGSRMSLLIFLLV